MKVSVFILFAITILFTTSCNRVKTIENIRLLDSLKNVLDTISKNQEEINFTGIQLRNDTFKTDMDSIAKYVTKIPTNKIHKKHFTLYTDLRHDFKRFNKINLTKDLQYSKKQILTLKEDVYRNSITKEQFYEYITTEQEAISLLKKQSDKQLFESEKILTYFEKSRPIIVEIIDSSKAVYSK